MEVPRRWIAYRNAISFSNFVHSSLEPADSLVTERVILVVSSIFLILLFVGFMTCLVLQPGSLIYQGKGIILTLPAVILLAGGGVVSVMMVAIGSCSWWLSLSSRTCK